MTDYNEYEPHSTLALGREITDKELESWKGRGAAAAQTSRAARGLTGDLNFEAVRDQGSQQTCWRFNAGKFIHQGILDLPEDGHENRNPSIRQSFELRCTVLEKR